MIPPSASQTIGPFWHLLEDPAWADLTRFGANGQPVTLGGAVTQPVTLSGLVRDGAGALVTDACLELWQHGPAFSGFGRCATDEAGRYRFTTVRPEGGPGAPHVALGIFARGLLHRVNTRIYFAGDPRNDADPVLQAIDPVRRSTLLAVERSPGAWVLDIRLQGEGETVFMAL